MQKIFMLDNFQILEKLGSGISSDVKLAKDMSTEKIFALKILKSKESLYYRDLLKKECEIMQSLNHENILVFHFFLEGEKFIYGVLEYAPKGDLFKILYNSFRFNENLILFYSKQFLNVISYLHRKGVAHRDLKLENFLLDENFKLKLADFGFSTKIQNQETKNDFIGTINYMAPEIYNSAENGYDAKKADIFSAGVVLFILTTKIFPFNYENEEFDEFDAFVKNSEKFWKACNFNKDFENLLKGMLNIDPENRFCIEEVLSSDWIKKDCDVDIALKDIKKIYQSSLKTSNNDSNINCDFTIKTNPEIPDYINRKESSEIVDSKIEDSQSKSRELNSNNYKYDNSFGQKYFTKPKFNLKNIFNFRKKIRSKFNTKSIENINRNKIIRKPTVNMDTSFIAKLFKKVFSFRGLNDSIKFF